MLKEMRYIGTVVVLAAIYYFAARFGLGLDAVSGFATLVWPPSGIALAALVLLGKRYWPAVAIGALLANYATGAPLLVAAGIGMGNAGEALLGAYLLERRGFVPSMTRLKDALSFLVFACVLSTLVSPVVGVASLLAGGVIAFPAAVPTWIAWWIGDILGVLIVGALLIVCADAIHRKARFRSYGEVAATFSVVIIVALLAYTDVFGAVSKSLPIVYLVLLPRLYVAFRFGPVGSTVAVFIGVFTAILSTVIGVGPFAGEDLSQSLTALQLYMGSTAAATLLVAAVNAERRKAEADLRVAAKDLEKKVAERTAQLAKSNAELERSKETLEKRRAVLSSVLHSLGEGVVAVDAAGDPIVYNPAAMKILGAAPSEMASPLEKLAERFPAYYADGATPVPFGDLPMTRALRGEQTANERLVVRSPAHPKGVQVAVTGNPIRDERGAIVGAVIVFREIAEEHPH